MSEPYVDPYTLRHPLDYGMTRTYSGGYIGPGASNVSTDFLPLIMLATYSSRFTPSVCYPSSTSFCPSYSASPPPCSFSSFSLSFLPSHSFLPFYFSFPFHLSPLPLCSFFFLILFLFLLPLILCFSFFLHPSCSSLFPFPFFSLPLTSLFLFSFFSLPSCSFFSLSFPCPLHPIPTSNSPSLSSFPSFSSFSFLFFLPSAFLPLLPSPFLLISSSVLLLTSSLCLYFYLLFSFLSLLFFLTAFPPFFRLLILHLPSSSFHLFSFSILIFLLPVNEFDHFIIMALFFISRLCFDADRHRTSRRRSCHQTWQPS